MRPRSEDVIEPTKASTLLILRSLSVLKHCTVARRVLLARRNIGPELTQTKHGDHRLLNVTCIIAFCIRFTPLWGLYLTTLLELTFNPPIGCRCRYGQRRGFHAAFRNHRATQSSSSSSNSKSRPANAGSSRHTEKAGRHRHNGREESRSGPFQSLTRTGCRILYTYFVGSRPLLRSSWCAR